MAEQKPTSVPSPTFSTILDAFHINQLLRKIGTIAVPTEQDVRFKRTHGMSRTDWDATLSLHLHGDLQ